MALAQWMPARVWNGGSVPDVVTGGPTGTNLVRAKRNTSASSGASGQREYLMLNVDLVIFDVAVEFVASFLNSRSSVAGINTAAPAGARRHTAQLWSWAEVQQTGAV
jgi:hypothetical protein